MILKAQTVTILRKTKVRNYLNTIRLPTTATSAKGMRVLIKTSFSLATIKTTCCPTKLRERASETTKQLKKLEVTPSISATVNNHTLATK